MWVWRLISGCIVVADLVELKCGIYDAFLSLERCRHLGLHRFHQNMCQVELALSTLFLGFGKTYPGSIAVDLILASVFGDIMIR